MANKKGISTALKRNLKDGKEYNKLIPPVRCERTNLGEGDTFYTVDAMRDWVEKFSFQTAKLAPKLVGRDLKETVDNIYKFLYSHIQYEADGALQQLRSPACTWIQRSSGVDCKSFSVFASSILSNLGIKHSIRQVRQPYFYPEEFTHVYVVVPKNQNDIDNSATFVLDATKHQNVEGKYIEKVDLKMNLKHIGLNAPQDERTQRIVDNFEKFCQFLLQKGASLETVNAIRTEVSKHTSAGLDPKIKFSERGIIVEGKAFPVRLVVEKYENGLGIEPMTTMATASAILEMLPPGFIDDTFGSLMANGFDLDCWGASNSPSKSKGEVAIDAPDLYRRSGLEASINLNNINKFVTYMEIYVQARKKGADNTSLSECTREGNRMGQQLMQEFYDKSLIEIRQKLSGQGYALQTEKRITVPAELQLKSSFADGRITQGKMGGVQVTAPVYKAMQTSNPAPTGDNNYQPGTGNLNNTSSGSSNTGLIIGGVAMAALPLFFMIKNKK